MVLNFRRKKSCKRKNKFTRNFAVLGHFPSIQSRIISFVENSVLFTPYFFSISIWSKLKKKTSCFISCYYLTRCCPWVSSSFQHFCQQRPLCLVIQQKRLTTFIIHAFIFMKLFSTLRTLVLYFLRKNTFRSKRRFFIVTTQQLYTQLVVASSGCIRSSSKSPHGRNDTNLTQKIQFDLFITPCCQCIETKPIGEKKTRSLAFFCQRCFKTLPSPLCTTMT